MDPQEGDIADGPGGQHMVYRGGVWHPSTEQGRPLERISRPDYGERYFELPNGDIVREGPRGGMEVIESAGSAGGGSTTVGADARGRYNMGAEPMRDAAYAMATEEARGGNPMNRDWGAVMLDGIGIDLPGDNDIRPFGPAARFFGGQDYQNYTQALATYEASLMPIQSGAAVSPSEARRQIRADFPSIGDSEETVRRKARNRLNRLNAVMTGLGRDPAFTPEEIANPTSISRDDDNVTGPMTANGLPSYPGIADMQRDVREIPAPAGGFGGGGPQPGDVSVTTQPLAPTDSPNSLAAQGYVYDPERDTWSRSRQEVVTPQSAVADRRDDWGVVRRPDAFMRGMADTVSMELADEGGAFANAAIGRGSGADFGERYRNNIQVERAIDAADGQDMPWTRRAGQAAGVAVALPRVLPQLMQRGAANVARNALSGGAMAATTAAGDTVGGFSERAENALKATPWGMVGGALAGPAINVLGRVASPLIEGATNALGNGVNAAVRATGRQGWDNIGSTPLSRGLDHFAGTNRPNADQMRTRAAELEASTGRPVTLIDSMNTGGRGVVRGASLRSDNARQLSEDFAVGRTEALPARISGQVRTHVSADRRTAQQITDETETTRSNLAREQYAEPYAEPVQIGDDIRGALQGAPGRAAIQRARAAAEAWQDGAVIADLDALQAAAANGQPLPPVSAAAVDRIRQAMSGRGEQLARQPGTRAVGAGIQNRAGQVDAALGNVEGLAPARATYQELSGQIEAAETGSRFMGGNPDQVTADLQGLSPEQLAVARATAARSIENAAGTTSTAPGAARRLYVPGTPQYQASEALLGQDGAARLASGVRGETDLVRNAQRASPAYGSNTNMDQEDTARATEGAVGAVGELFRGRPVTAAAKLMDGLRARGFNAEQSEAFIRAAQDPAQTQTLITELAQRMSRREARNLVRTLRYVGAGGVGRATAPEVEITRAGTYR